MKIAIVGVGGVGGYYGALLARAGNEVTFVARGEQFKALKKSGLTLKTVTEEFSINPVSVVENISELKDPYLVLIATKTYDLNEVSVQLEALNNPSIVIIPLLNGIDIEMRVRSVVKHGIVYPGLTYIISARTAPGRIEQTGGPCTIYFGDRKNPDNPVLSEVAQVMRAAGIVATVSRDIDRELWTKFIWITTFAGMTSICRSTIGEIVNDNGAYSLCISCLDEGIRVANAVGVKLGENFIAELVKKVDDYRTKSSQAKSSMLVDIENHRRTEIETLNGALVKIAKEKGVSVPLHEMIYYAIRLASASAR